MKNAILITVAFLSITMVEQKSNSKIIEIPKNECTKKVSNHLKIYCNGGVGSIITKNDILFQKKYSVIIVDLGCVRATGKRLESLTVLNKKTFEFLKSKYALKWVSELKQDAIGFMEWKAK